MVIPSIAAPPAATFQMQPGDREDLQYYQSEAERMAETIRLRDEWLQAARARLWARQERLREFQRTLVPPPPYMPVLHAESAPEPVDELAPDDAPEPALLPAGT